MAMAEILNVTQALNEIKDEPLKFTDGSILSNWLCPLPTGTIRKTFLLEGQQFIGAEMLPASIVGGLYYRRKRKNVRGVLIC